MHGEGDLGVAICLKLWNLYNEDSKESAADLIQTLSAVKIQEGAEAIVKDQSTAMGMQNTKWQTPWQLPPEDWVWGTLSKAL